MKTISNPCVASARRSLTLLALPFALGVASVLSSVAPAQAQMHHKMSMTHRISVAQAERIARNYVGRGARVVRNEGVRNGAYRIHVHKNGIAHHVYVGSRTGRVVKVHTLSISADRHEDHPRR